MAGMTIELSEHVIDAIADAVVKKMQEPTVCDIEQIRAEIEQLRADFMKQGGEFEHSAYGLDYAMQIIDKHTKGGKSNESID